MFDWMANKYWNCFDKASERTSQIYIFFKKFTF